jgi:glutamate transport system substrate-binding protein
MRLTRTNSTPIRLVVTALAVATLTIGLSACSSSSTGSASATPADPYDKAIASAPIASASLVSSNDWAKKIKAAGALRIGGTDTAPLFSLKDPVTGKTTGFDAGLAAMLAQYITGKPNTKLTITTVDTRESLIQNNTVDAVFATYSITPARAAKVAFAGPYFQSGDAIMVAANNTDIKNVSDLAGKTVTTEANSTAVTALEADAPSAKPLLFSTDAECVAALQQGRADAYVIDQSILISDAVGNNKVKVVGKPFTTDPYGIGVTRSDPAAKQFVDAWLKKIYADGSWARLWKATVGTVVAGNAPTPPTIGWVPGS